MVCGESGFSHFQRSNGISATEGRKFPVSNQNLAHYRSPLLPSHEHSVNDLSQRVGMVVGHHGSITPEIIGRIIASLTTDPDRGIAGGSVT